MADTVDPGLYYPWSAWRGLYRVSAQVEAAMADDTMSVEELKRLREDELIDFIRETVVMLNLLADRLEHHITEEPQVEQSDG